MTDPPAITPKQVQLLNMLLRRHVDPGRDAAARRRRHSHVEWMLNRNISSTTTLSRTEASDLIDGLIELDTDTSRRRPEPEPEPAPPAPPPRLLTNRTDIPDPLARRAIIAARLADLDGGEH